MTKDEKSKISRLRLAGKSYEAIAKALSLSGGAVKTYCHRNHLTNAELVDQNPLEQENICPQCGKAVVQGGRGKRRRFCSEACRIAWWSENRDLANQTAYYSFLCLECGKAFDTYGNKNRKFCSRRCYIQHRYHKQGGDSA